MVELFLVEELRDRVFFIYIYELFCESVWFFICYRVKFFFFGFVSV